MLWHRAAYCPQLPIIQQAYDQLDRPCLLPYIIFLLMISWCFPTLNTGNPPPYPNPPLTKEQQIQLLRQWSDLKEAINQGGQRQPYDVKNSNSLLYDAALNSLRNWISHDLESALEDIEECAIQASIISSPQMDPLPIQIACIVATQLVGLHIFSQSHSSPYSNPSSMDNDFYSLKQNQRSQNKTRRMINFVEMLLKSLGIASQWHCKVVENFIKETLDKWLKEVGLTLGFQGTKIF